MTGWFPFEELPEGVGSRSYLGPTPSASDTEPPDSGGPQAFLVHWATAQGTLRVHWHRVPQFQVFVGGRGRFGHHAVGPGSVHYSDAFTPYGSLTAEVDETYFLTLRADSDRGAFIMPESQTDLQEVRRQHPGPHRNLSFDLRDAPAGMVQTDADGMQIDVVEIDPEKKVFVDGGSGTAYAVVLDGGVENGGHDVGPGGVRHVTGTAAIRSGAEGSRVAVLRFPKRNRLPA